MWARMVDDEVTCLRTLSENVLLKIYVKSTGTYQSIYSMSELVNSLKSSQENLPFNQL